MRNFSNVFHIHFNFYDRLPSAEANAKNRQPELTAFCDKVLNGLDVMSAVEIANPLGSPSAVQAKI